MLYSLIRGGENMDLRSFLTPKKKKQTSPFWKKLKIITFLCLFILAGIGFKETYAIYSTLARTPPAEASTISEILKVNGEFDVEEWLDSGNSGLEISNVSAAKIWVYFNIEGELIQAIQHIEPVCLEPGQTYMIPLVPVNTPPLKARGAVNELGLLGWKNNKQEFSGRIIAGVLNGYAGYEIGIVSVNGEDIYKHFVLEKEKGIQIEKAGEPSEVASANSLSEIENINDILLLIADKIALLKERDELRAQIDRLILENEELVKENTRLRRRVDSLEADVSSLQDSLEGAKKQIDELQKPPAEEPPTEEPSEPNPGNEKPDPQENDGDSGDQPGNGSGDQSGEPPKDNTGSTPINDSAPGNKKPDPQDSVSNPGDQTGNGSGNQSGEPAKDDTGSTPINEPASSPTSNGNSDSEPGGQSTTQPSTGQEGE
jgi:hypothetical protein